MRLLDGGWLPPKGPPRYEVSGGSMWLGELMRGYANNNTARLRH